MKREDYGVYYKNLKLSENQQELLLDKIDNNYLSFNMSSDLEEDGFIEAFNTLYWFFVGELDTKDEFYDDEYDEVLSITVIKDLKIEENKKSIVENFYKDLNSILSKEQIEELKKALKVLYVRPKTFVENKYYFNNKYQTGKIKTELCLLEFLNN